MNGIYYGRWEGALTWLYWCQILHQALTTYNSFYGRPPALKMAIEQTWVVHLQIIASHIRVHDTHHARSSTSCLHFSYVLIGWIVECSHVLLYIKHEDVVLQAASHDLSVVQWSNGCCLWSPSLSKTILWHITIGKFAIRLSCKLL